MGEFLEYKDKYVFSSKKKYDKKIDTFLVSEQVRLLRSTCRKFDINIKSLESMNPNEKRRNLLLNVAKFCIDSKEIMTVFQKSKRLPDILVGQETGLKIDIIRKWREYLTFYIILFSDNKLFEIVKYLNIEASEIDQLTRVRVVDETDKGIFKGIAVGMSNKSIILLTRQGLLRKIKYSKEHILGDEVRGVYFEGNKFKVLKGLGVLAILALIVNTCFAFYNKDYATLVIKTTSEIKLDVNEFNKVTEATSPTQKGKTLISDISLENKSVDESLVNILEYIDKNEMVPENGVIDIIVTGEKVNFDSFSKTIDVVKKQSEDVDKKSREFSLLINNSGIEQEIRANVGVVK